MRLFNFLFILGLVVNIQATTITLTSPTAPMTFKDGDEYFTDVMNNAIDFDKRRDILWEELFYENTISALNNEWKGSYAPGGYVMPLFQGMDGAIQNGLIGNNYPLDSSKYTAVSILGKVAARYNPDLTSWFTLFWTHDSSYHNASWQSIAGIDGYQLHATGEVLMHPDNDYIHYLHDLSSNSEWTSTAIRGIKLSPSNQASPSVGYKSIRVFDPTTSPLLNISWTTTDLNASAPVVPQVEVYIDSDNLGFDGNLFFRFDGGNSFFRERTADTNSFNLPTAALAPGEYYIYLKLYSDYDVDGTDTDTLLATSEYSAKITINAKSVITFENPSMASGEDYATTILGNAWDMNDSVDIGNMYNIGSTDFSSGLYTATTSNDDPYFFLNVDTQNPIDTSRYRYVSLTMEINDSTVTGSTYGANITEKVAVGWMSRFFWGDSDIDGNSVTNDIVLYEGLKTYTIDLTRDVSDDTISTPTLWETYATNGYLRFDPLEIPTATEFYIYDFKLTANPEPQSDGKFTIEFTLEDKENDVVNVAFYRDNDATGFNGTLIGSKSYTKGSNTYLFDTCNLEVGDYFLYFIATDSVGNVSKYYAEVPVSVVNAIKCEEADMLDLYMMGILPSIIGNLNSK